MRAQPSSFVTVVVGEKDHPGRCPEHLSFFVGRIIRGMTEGLFARMVVHIVSNRGEGEKDVVWYGPD